MEATPQGKVAQVQCRHQPAYISTIGPPPQDRKSFPGCQPTYSSMQLAAPVVRVVTCGAPSYRHPHH